MSMGNYCYLSVEREFILNMLEVLPAVLLGKFEPDVIEIHYVLCDKYYEINIDTELNNM